MPECCLRVAEPGPWKAGKDDSADPYMVERMHAVMGRLSHNMSTDDLTWMCRASAALDQRTRLGYHIQCCVLHNAASRLELLSTGKDPMPWAHWINRLRNGWEVFRGRAFAIEILSLPRPEEKAP